MNKKSAIAKLALGLLLGIVGGCAPESIDPPLLLSSHQVLVKPGDTLYKVAGEGGVSVKRLMEHNRLDNTLIKPGQVLTIPPKEEEVGFVEAAPIEKKDIQTPPEESGTPSQGNSPNLDAEKPLKDSEPVTNTAAFIWPVSGDIIQNFGQGSGVLKRGIKIRGFPGENVRATAEGKVFHTGSDLKDYGTMIIVKHSDGSLAVYGLLENQSAKVHVKKGDQVSQGQTLAQFSTHIVRGEPPQLYFEMRRLSNGKKVPEPINPIPLLGQ
jgi:murein DD-endopeptidase MepM/ murein hydrolase activator NlpD